MEQTRRTSLRKRAIICAAAVAMAFIVAIMGAIPAHALDVGDAQGTTGSITVHKYKTTTPSTTPGTGEGGQKVDGELVKGVRFTLYSLDTAKVETGANVTGDPYAGKPLAKAPAISEVSAAVAAYGNPTGLDGTGKSEKLTDANGVITFSNLPFGYYLLVETGAPEGMAASVPTVISVPYASQAHDGTVTYITDVHVYPKNVSTDLVSKKEMSGKEYVEIGDTLRYRITLGLPGADKVLAGDTAFMKVKATDILPTNEAGEPVVDYKAGSARLYAALADGTLIDLSTLGSSALTSTEPAIASGQLVWDFTANASLARAIEQVNDTYAANPATHLIIDIETVVNGRAVAPSESGESQTPAVNNKVEATMHDAEGSAIIDGDKGRAESGDLYSAGFGFSKVAASQGPSNDYLQGAEFALLAIDPGDTFSTEKDGLKGVFVKQGVTEGAAKANWLTAASTGQRAFVSFGSLTGYKDGTGAQEYFKYWDGTKLVDYTAMNDAAQEAIASPGTAKSVDMWIAETKAPDGYQKAAKAIKVTVDVSKASATEPLRFTVASVDGQPVSAGGFTVENVKYGQGAFALPNTGGTGALLIMAAGAAIIIGAVLAGRRSKKEERRSQ